MNLKKKWKRPQLVVIVRGESAEQVLSLCKVWNHGPGPSVVTGMGCIGFFGSCPNNCSTQGWS